MPTGDASGVAARVKSWKVAKKTDDGVLYEVIEQREGEDGPVVTFRREGLAPPESYATGLPVKTKG